MGNFHWWGWSILVTYYQYYTSQNMLLKWIYQKRASSWVCSMFQVRVETWKDFLGKVFLPIPKLKVSSWKPSIDEHLDCL